MSYSGEACMFRFTASQWLGPIHVMLSDALSYAPYAAARIHFKLFYQLSSASVDWHGECVGTGRYGRELWLKLLMRSMIPARNVL